MPLPFVVWAAAAAAAAYGAKKGIDAFDDFDKAKKIGERAQKKYEDAKKSHERSTHELQQKSQALGTLKLDIFQKEIAYTVEVIKRLKSAQSQLKDFQTIFTEREFKTMVHSVNATLEIKGAGEALAGGALAGLGVYGAVGMLASASTGTAIATLSGAAATNATLAWLGGGSLAAGGFGMGGGLIALGGIVAGPALLIGGFILASKAEESVSNAREFEAEADVAIEKINGSIVMMQHVVNKICEVEEVINSLRLVFNQVRVPLDCTDQKMIEKMLIAAKGLKSALDINIITESGLFNEKSGDLLLAAKHYGLKAIS